MSDAEHYIAISAQEQEALEYVVKLWHEAGSPSSRTVAGWSHVSHTTVNDILRGYRFPAWASLRAIVVALGGDADVIQSMMGPAYLGRGRMPKLPGPLLSEILTELRAIRRLMEKQEQKS